MNKTLALASIVVATTLAACGDPVPPQDSGTAPGSTSGSVAVAPPAQPDRNAPPAPPPATHNESPKEVVPAQAAPTARDTPAQQPLKELTPAEESRSMPKPGQGDSHSSPSLDAARKGTDAPAK